MYVSSFSNFISQDLSSGKIENLKCSSILHQWLTTEWLILNEAIFIINIVYLNKFCNFKISKKKITSSFTALKFWNENAVQKYNDTLIKISITLKKSVID